jgi:hypothetical protein
MTTPSLTNPNPKREDERVEAALSAWMETSELGLPHWSTGCKPATIEHMRKCMAAALTAATAPTSPSKSSGEEA